jgi:DNA-binding HxlR family transcriptional regulator
MSEPVYSCGLEAALDVIGGKWKVLILWQAEPGPRRFGELKRLVPGISEKMLIQQLREMEADGVIRRKVYHEVPPKVEYSLTQFGVSLKAALAPLCDWGTRHVKRIGAAHRGCEAGPESQRIPANA